MRSDGAFRIVFSCGSWWYLHVCGYNNQESCPMISLVDLKAALVDSVLSAGFVLVGMLTYLAVYDFLTRKGSENDKRR